MNNENDTADRKVNTFTDLFGIADPEGDMMKPDKLSPCMLKRTTQLHQEN